MTSPGLEERRLSDDERGSDLRSEFARDRDRVLYSHAFRRLGGITQVAAVSETHLLHTRLTHSLKVAQVARRLAEGLGRDPEHGLDADMVEAAALCHDIGHPPFGHVAEHQIDKILRAESGVGFEGNAQSFRIVGKLAIKKRPASSDWPDLCGLNLTRGTLGGVLKYPGSDDLQNADERLEDRSFAKKRGAYPSEDQLFLFARQDLTDGERTNAAILVDLADDLSYATHDLEDYVRAGLVPLHDFDETRLQNQIERRLSRRQIRFNKTLVAEAIDEVRSTVPPDSYSGTRESERALQLHTSITLSQASSLVALNDEGRVTIDPALEYRLEVLKTLTWLYVILDPSLRIAQVGQTSMTERVLREIHRWTRSDPESYSPRLGSLLTAAKTDWHGTESDLQWRVAADFLCMLTEPQVREISRRITGQAEETFGRWSP